MAASVTKLNDNRGRGDVEVAARGHDNACFRDDKRTIELRQGSERSTGIGVGYVRRLWSVAVQRIEDERAGVAEDVSRAPYRKERADASSFSSLTRNLGRQRQDRLEHIVTARRVV